MKHVCHAWACDTEIAPRLFMCPGHWRSLSPELQAAIRREYRAGQEKDKRPSARYMAVAALAIASTIPGGSKDRGETAKRYRIDSAHNWRRIAIHRGDGDPLEGLVPATLGA